MTVPFSNLLVQRTSSGKWQFTHDPVEQTADEKKISDRFPRYGGGRCVHVVDHNGVELASRIVLSRSLPGYERHAQETTAGVRWEQDVFAYIHTGGGGRQYGVVFPWWGALPPLVIDLVELVPTNQYDLQDLQNSYRNRIWRGVRAISADTKLRTLNGSENCHFPGEYSHLTAYLHHAVLLEMTELEDTLRNIKTAPDDKNSFGSMSRAATVALNRLGFTDEVGLVEAAAAGDLDRMKALLPKANANFKLMDERYETISYYAYNDGSGSSALYAAAKNGHTEAVRLLLQVPGIDIYQKAGRSGQRPLHVASNIDILMLLLEKDKAEQQTNEKATTSGLQRQWQLGDCRRYSPLHTFCASNSKEFVEEILRYGTMDVDWSGYGGETSLHLACDAGHFDIAILLLEAGASVDAKTRAGKTPFYLAALNGHNEIVESLLRNDGIDVNVTPKESGAYNAKIMEPALCIASKRGDELMVNRLLNHPSLSQISLQPALVGAVECHKQAIAKLILGHHAIDASCLRSALLEAVKQSNTFLASHLLAHSLSDVQCIKDALVAASTKEDTEMIRFLLGHDKMNPAICGPPALDAACSQNKVAAVKQLLDAIEIHDWKESGVAVYSAAKNDHKDILELLVYADADLTYADDVGWTALHFIVEKTRTDAVRLLLENGADPNVTDKSGLSSLHVACAIGNTELVTLLLGHGANDSLKSLRGETPLDVARARKHLDVMRLLVLRISGEIAY